MPPINLNAQPDFPSRRYQRRYTYRRHADHEDQANKTPAKISAIRSEATEDRIYDYDVPKLCVGTFYAAKLKSQLLNLGAYAPTRDDVVGQGSVKDRNPSRFSLADSLQTDGRSPISEAHSHGEVRSHDTDGGLKETARADEVYETLMTRIYQ